MIITAPRHENAGVIINSMEKKHMKDGIFIDSNILIYAVSKHSLKYDVGRQLLIKNVEQITLTTKRFGDRRLHLVTGCVISILGIITLGKLF